MKDEKIQKSQYPLHFSEEYIEEAQKVIDALHELPRSGWLDRGVNNPETVGEHSDELVSLAEELFNIRGLAIMLKIHDWPESEKNVGDRRTDNLCPIEKRCTPEKKKKDETEAIHLICSRLGSYGQALLKLWLEFEEKKTKRAILAHDLDKYQAIKKAIEYELKGEPVVAQDFIDYYGPKISRRDVRYMMEMAIYELKNGQNTKA